MAPSKLVAHTSPAPLRPRASLAPLGLTVTRANPKLTHTPPLRLGRTANLTSNFSLMRITARWHRDYH